MKKGKFFPNFTIDAKKTAFRDDAVGLRPRLKDKIVGGNKFELVVSIADVSCVYGEGEGEGQAEGESEGGLDKLGVGDARVLKKAAQARCMSRYDLPFGPLHLLPPPVLEGLSIREGDKNEVRECEERSTAKHAAISL